MLPCKVDAQGLFKSELAGSVASAACFYPSSDTATNPWLALFGVARPSQNHGRTVIELHIRRGQKNRQDGLRLKGHSKVDETALLVCSFFSPSETEHVVLRHGRMHRSIETPCEPAKVC